MCTDGRKEVREGGKQVVRAHVSLLTRLAVAVYSSFWLQRCLIGLEYPLFLLYSYQSLQDAKIMQSHSVALY